MCNASVLQRKAQSAWLRRKARSTGIKTYQYSILSYAGGDKRAPWPHDVHQKCISPDIAWSCHFDQPRLLSSRCMHHNPCYTDFPSSLVCKATNCHLNWHHRHPLSKRQKVVLYKVIPNFLSAILPECPQDSGKYMSPYFFSYTAAEGPPPIYFRGGHDQFKKLLLWALNTSGICMLCSQSSSPWSWSGKSRLHFLVFFQSYQP